MSSHQKVRINSGLKNRNKLRKKTDDWLPFIHLYFKKTKKQFIIH